VMVPLGKLIILYNEIGKPSGSEGARFTSDLNAIAQVALRRPTAECETKRRVVGQFEK
jgi:hypothetical protein